MATIKNTLAVVSATLLISACSTQERTEQQATPSTVLETYTNIAQAKYSDSLESAKMLGVSIDNFLTTPTEANLSIAKNAWISARIPYQQTEVYRFGNAAVDDWEGKVNAWPLDEGLIDYVDTGYGSDSDENPYYTANIVANAMPTISGKKVDASSITPKLLSDTLHEIDEVESNVATGYHAIEFLLWGQDLNGTSPGAGNRQSSDFSLDACTGGNCDRRRAYLKAATDLLIEDLNDMAISWKAGGEAFVQLSEKGETKGIATILTGMGSLAYGELAGERIKLGLMLHDPEEEHDCFSDNTHWSHYYDAKGIKNIYLGSYERIDGSIVSGASLSELVASVDSELDSQMRTALDKTENAMQIMVDEANKGNTFDVLIGEGNMQGNQIVQNVVDALVAQTKVTEKLVTSLNLDNISIEGSDSLDNPSTVH